MKIDNDNELMKLLMKYAKEFRENPELGQWYNYDINVYKNALKSYLKYRLKNGE